MYLFQNGIIEIPGSPTLKNQNAFKLILLMNQFLGILGWLMQ